MKRRARKAGPDRRRQPVSALSAPWPVLALLLAMLVPAEASQYIGSLRISAYRAVLIAVVPWCLLQVARRRVGRWMLCDALMLLFVTWAFVSIGAHHGLAQAVESGGVYALEGFGGYLVARCCIRRVAAFSSTVALLSGVAIALLLATLPEMLTGRHYVHEAARALFGGEPVLDKATRLGLHRAYGPFPHPILYGVFCASCIGLAWYGLAAGAWRRIARVGAILLATLASLSSGPLFAVVAQAGVIGWDRLTRGLRGRWVLLAVLLVAGWITVDVLSNRTPAEVALTRLAFNPVTGYARWRIWQHGLEHVRASPWTGIGLDDWSDVEVIGASIDNFWIFTAVKFGLPTALLLLAAIVTIAFRLSRVRGRGSAIPRIRMAWVTSMAGLCVAGCGVHYWDELFVVFSFLVGSVTWLLDRP